MKKRGKNLERFFNYNFLKKNRKGQVTIFIIIAVIVVVLGVLIFMFYPQIKTTLGFEPQNPYAFIQSCIEGDIENAVGVLSVQGGRINPQHYFLYDNQKLEYLCYTNTYYQTCVVQIPFLKQHIEFEIKNEIEDKVKECFSSLKENYEKRGYEVNLKKGDFGIELAPEKIVSEFNYKLTLTKEDSQTYDEFVVVLDNNLYELASIAESIVEWEATYGDSETTTYMNYYHDLKVEKKKQTDGTTIYIVTNRDTRNKFQFASRSVAWPPGYGNA
ncbi:hypothetical protein KAJ87_02755 [Candidatus Pacearchaeota archaeon]|nr:hypothetical protein [Candidatus Pacearchaeota archaeon]